MPLQEAGETVVIANPQPEESTIEPQQEEPAVIPADELSLVEKIIQFFKELFS